MLTVSQTIHDRMVAHALAGMPAEACGLLGATFAEQGTIVEFVPCVNEAASAKYYEIGREGWDRADEVLGPNNLLVVGMMHSHTHTDPFPSATDIDEASNPMLGDDWRYLIVSLRDRSPMMRSYRITDGKVAEEPIHVVPG